MKVIVNHRFTLSLLVTASKRGQRRFAGLWNGKFNQRRCAAYCGWQGACIKIIGGAGSAELRIQVYMRIYRPRQDHQAIGSNNVLSCQRAGFRNSPDATMFIDAQIRLPQLLSKDDQSSLNNCFKHYFFPVLDSDDRATYQILLPLWSFPA